MSQHIFHKRIFFLLFSLVLFLNTENVFSQTEESSLPLKERPSVALVLGGGGAKGFGIIPVLEVIDELEIPIDMIIGNSAGAIIGGLYSIGYTPAEIRQLVTNVEWSEMFADRPYSPIESLLEERGTEASPISFKLGKNFTIESGSGFSTGQNAFLMLKDFSIKIPSYIDFDSLPIPFRAAAVNLTTGQLDLIGSGDIAEAIRSSMSIPGVFQPFPVDDKLYVDGLVRNNLPIKQAKDMGFDIIIAVSLDDPLVDSPDYLDVNPFNLLSQVALIITNSADPEQLKLADVIIHPPVNDYNMMEFPKAREIYETAEKDKPKYRQALKAVLPLIYPNQAEETQTEVSGEETTNSNISQAQESIATHQSVNATYNGFTFTPSYSVPEEKEGIYQSMPYMVPQQLEVFGAVESDIPFIHELFNRIEGESLTSTNLKSFVNEIYNTGNYTLVIPRVDIRNRQTTIELRLQQKESENWVIIPNGNFMGNITDDSIAKLSLSLDLQFRGLTGTGSVMSLKTTMINDFGAAWLYLQPLGPHAYIQLSAAASLEQEFITSGFTERKITANKMTYANSELLWGIRFNNNHRLQAGGAVYWINTDETTTAKLETQTELYPHAKVDVAIPLNIRYTFSTFDSPTFPSKGFYLRFNNTGVFPVVKEDDPIAFNITKVDFSAAIPVAPKFSLIANALAYSDVSLQLEKIPNLIPFFGPSLGDRMFFPNISGKQQYGTHKFAVQAVLQFQPWNDITVIGGQLFFNITGTIGIIAMNHNSFSTNGINWNASLGSGLRINDTFSIMLRVGAGTTHNKVMPFVSLDVGSIRY